MRRSTNVPVFSEIKQADSHVQNLVSGKVYLLTDGRCFSSDLIFVDSILSILGVVHIRITTNANTRFSQPILLQLPSGKSDRRVPTMIRRNWEREDNEPYRPYHVFHGFMGDKKELETWIISLSDTDHEQ